MEAQNKTRFAFQILGLTYAVGEFLQWGVIGPNWIRWHLSDFGFSFSCAGAAIYLFGLTPKKEHC